MSNYFAKLLLGLAFLVALVFIFESPAITTLISHSSGGNNSKIFEGNISNASGARPLYDVIIEVTPSGASACAVPYTDRTMTARSFKFIVPATSFYPGDNLVKIRAYDEKGDRVYSTNDTYTNNLNQSCLQQNQTAQWKDWRHEMFIELTRDASNGILRYPARNVPKREDVNRELRQWLIDNGYASPPQIGENEQLVTDILALANQHDEILVWTLGDNLTQIINATNSTRLWVTRKDIPQAMSAETGGVSGTYLSCSIG